MSLSVIKNVKILSVNCFEKRGCHTDLGLWDVIHVKNKLNK